MSLVRLAKNIGSWLIRSAMELLALGIVEAQLFFASIFVRGINRTRNTIVVGILRLDAALVTRAVDSLVERQSNTGAERKKSENRQQKLHERNSQKR